MKCTVFYCYPYFSIPTSLLTFFWPRKTLKTGGWLSGVKSIPRHFKLTQGTFLMTPDSPSWPWGLFVPNTFASQNIILLHWSHHGCPLAALQKRHNITDVAVRHNLLLAGLPYSLCLSAETFAALVTYVCGQSTRKSLSPGTWRSLWTRQCGLWCT